MVKQERASSSKLATSSPDHSGSSSVKYKGVRKRKWGKYVSEIRLPNSRERIWLGSYDTPEKAARAFDAALFCLRGNNANFNFPDQPPQIPGGRSLPTSQIQAAAARFANHYYSHNCTTTDDNSSNSINPSEEDFPSPSLITTTDMGDTISWTSPFFIEDDFTNSSSNSSSGYMNIFDHININNIETNTNVGVPDYGIFPGFDDYFMTTLPQPTTDDNDYGEENCYSQYLWNF